MSLMILLVLNCSTKVSEKSDMAKSWAARLSCVPAVASATLSGCRAAASRVEELFVAQELINKVKLKCCGIKDNEKT
jgi:hypothetical protein